MAEKLRRIIPHHLSPMIDRADFVRVFQRERRVGIERIADQFASLARGGLLARLRPVSK